MQMTTATGTPLETEAKIPFFTSFRGKITMILLLLSLIPLLGLGIYSQWRTQETLAAAEKEQLNQATIFEADSIKEWLDERVNDMTVFASTDQVKSMQGGTIEPFLELIEKQYGIFEGLFVIGPDGKTVATSVGKSLDLSDQDYFKQAIKGEAAVSDAHVSTNSGDMVISVAVPVKVDGKIVGVMGGAVSTHALAASLQSGDTQNTDETYLINSDGFFITPSRFEDRLKKEGLIKNQTELELKVDTLASEEALAGKSGVAEYTNYDGQQVMGAYKPVTVGNTRWAIISEQSTDEAFAEATELRNITIGLIALMAILVVIIGLVVSGSITAPVKVCVKEARLLAQGDLLTKMSQAEKEAVVLRKDEFGQLGEGFRGMEVYMTSMADVAQKIAAGDLTQTVTPACETDVLGHAFAAMNEQLNSTLARINSESLSVAAASQQLTDASEQAGAATSQVATTIQQVAKGTSEQTSAITKATSQVE
jgi:HAMP domain-containing protein